MKIWILLVLVVLVIAAALSFNSYNNSHERFGVICWNGGSVVVQETDCTRSDPFWHCASGKVIDISNMPCVINKYWKD